MSSDLGTGLLDPETQSCCEVTYEQPPCPSLPPLTLSAEGQKVGAGGVNWLNYSAPGLFPFPSVFKKIID